MYSLKENAKKIFSEYGICLFILSVAAVLFILPGAAVENTVSIEISERDLKVTEQNPEYYGKISVCEGKVAAYLSDGTLIKKTDISVNLLPKELEREIQAGIVAKSENELFSLLDSFDS